MIIFDILNGGVMAFLARREELLKRAKRVEKRADCEEKAQAKDLLLALAVLYREMANELEEGSKTPSYMPRPVSLIFVAVCGDRNLQ
jgi:hypothetical protein